MRGLTLLQNSASVTPTLTLGYRDNCATMYEVATGGTPCPYAPSFHPTSTLAFTTPAEITSQAGPTATRGPDRNSFLRKKKSYRVDSVPDSPKMWRDEVLNAIKELCKQNLRGTSMVAFSTKCLLLKPPIFVQAWVYQDRSGDCMNYPFIGNEYKHADNFEAMCKWALQSAIDGCKCLGMFSINGN